MLKRVASLEMRLTRYEGREREGGKGVRERGRERRRTKGFGQVEIGRIWRER